MSQYPAHPTRRTASLHQRTACLLALALPLALAPAGLVRANEPAPAPAAKSGAAAAPASPSSGQSIGKDIAAQLREAMESGQLQKKQLTLKVSADEPTKAPAAKAAAMPAPAQPASNLKASRQYIRAKAAALAAKPDATESHQDNGHEVHWGYEGDAGPQAWSKLKPEFGTCASGRRQSPIHIEESATLQGPAEVLQFSYKPSNATVVNNGHTIQVDMSGDNTLTVRGSTFKLLQFHFHNPSEERVNFKTYAMVVHLVHKNDAGPLAVVAVLLDPGVTNTLINKVWTYMPLEVGDRVSMPADFIDLNELLPEDRRYYQFMGSLTTPPCSEDVLWMVLKQPRPVSQDQLKLFARIFPHNARPIQAVNGRVVRSAQ